MLLAWCCRLRDAGCRISSQSRGRSPSAATTASWDGGSTRARRAAAQASAARDARRAPTRPPCRRASASEANLEMGAWQPAPGARPPHGQPQPAAGAGQCAQNTQQQRHGGSTAQQAACCGVRGVGVALAAASGASNARPRCGRGRTAGLPALPCRLPEVRGAIARTDAGLRSAASERTALPGTFMLRLSHALPEDREKATVRSAAPRLRGVQLAPLHEIGAGARRPARRTQDRPAAPCASQRATQGSPVAPRSALPPREARTAAAAAMRMLAAAGRGVRLRRLLTS